jgi:hypothetical protein
MIRANRNQRSCSAKSSDLDDMLDPFEQRIFGLFSAVGRTLSGEGFALWRRLLADLPLDSLDYAIGCWLAETDSGFPTIAALRKLAIEHKCPSLPDATEAFGSVCKAVRTIHYEFCPEEFRKHIGEMAWQALQNCGGPRWFGDMTEDQRPVFAAQFRRAYEALASREERRRLLPGELQPQPRLAESQAPVIRPARSFEVPGEKPERIRAFTVASKAIEETRPVPAAIPTVEEFERQKSAQLMRFRQQFGIEASGPSRATPEMPVAPADEATLGVA